MHVCHVITRFIRGGADENTLYSCNGQAATGCRVSLVHGGNAHPQMLARLDPAVEQYRLDPLRREVSPLHDLAALGRLTALLAKLRPDIVHTHTSKTGILGRLAARLAGVPVIVHGVHILPFLSVGPVKRQCYLALEKAMVPFTDFFIDVGQAMLDESLRYGLGAPHQHRVIPSGMDTEAFVAAGSSRPDFRALLPGFDPPSAGPRFLALVSALEPRKRQYEFLDVFAALIHDVPETVLLLVGEGPDHDRLQRRAAELGLARHVVLTGFREDVAQIMALADVCLLASRREGLPRVLIQYALTGRPIIATDIPGSAEVVCHGENGFLVDAGDLAQMLPPLRRLLHDADLRAAMGESSRRRDLSRWGVGHMVTEIAQVYTEVLRGKNVDRLEPKIAGRRTVG